MDWRGLARRKMLEDIYDKMSPEEKRMFVMLTMQDAADDEIMGAIMQNRKHLERLVEHADKDRWIVSFGSDVAANVFTDGLLWLARRLFRK